MKDIQFLTFAVLAKVLFKGIKADCSGCDEALFDVPVYDYGCEDDVKPGGVGGWFMIRCDAQFTDITDEAEWDAKIAAGQIKGIFDCTLIRGSLPVPDRTTVPVGACGTPKTISKTYTLSIIDSGYDAGLTRYNLYDYIDKFGQLWNFGFITADFFVYGPYSNVNAQVDENIPETNSEVKDFQFTVSWIAGKGVNIPVQLPFLDGKKLTN